MTRRRRLLAGLLALAALTLGLAESVWASTCAPAMALAGAAATAEAPADPDCAQHDGHESRDGEPADAPHCPLGPAAAAQGCLSVASLPSVFAEPPAYGPDSDASPFIEPAHRDLLSARTPFHPPRA